MSCVTVSPAMRSLLDRLSGSANVEVEALRSMPEWDQAVEWGWIIGGTGELTGTGLAHVRELPRGLVKD